MFFSFVFRLGGSWEWDSWPKLNLNYYALPEPANRTAPKLKWLIAFSALSHFLLAVASAQKLITQCNQKLRATVFKCISQPPGAFATWAHLHTSGAQLSVVPASQRLPSFSLWSMISIQHTVKVMLFLLYMCTHLVNQRDIIVCLQHFNKCTRMTKCIENVSSSVTSGWLPRNIMEIVARVGIVAVLPIATIYVTHSQIQI